MRCLYYLAPTLESTHRISDDLHAAGIKDFFLHVIAKDESGLELQHIHSSNYLETLDIIRDGFIGAAIGALAGLVGAGLLMFFQPFGDIPHYVYFIIVAVATMFGAWEGGLTGIATENNNLKKFHRDIEAGKYLILIYARKEQGAARAAPDARQASRRPSSSRSTSISSTRSSRCGGGTGRPEGTKQHCKRIKSWRWRSCWCCWSLARVLFHYLSPWYFTPIASNWGHDRRHRFDHVLGDGIRLRRRQPVHGVLRAALSKREGEGRALRAREQEARGLARPR